LVTRLAPKCHNPTLAKCGGEAQHSQSWGFGVLRDSRMFRVWQQGPKHLALRCLGVIEKVLKRRYRKWPLIGHLDICRPSYGQKKGRESNWQFDSQPLKVENRPLPDLRMESAIWRWKDLDKGDNFGSDLVTIRPGSRELWAPKVPGLQPGQFWDNFGIPTWESQEKEPFGCNLSGVSQRILYGRSGGFPRVRAMVSLVIQSARGLSQHLRVSRNVKLTPCGWFMDADSSLIF